MSKDQGIDPTKWVDKEESTDIGEDMFGWLDNTVGKSAQLMRKKYKLYNKVFTSPEGKQVLEDLKAQVNYDGTTGPLPVEDANYRLGSTSVVSYILQLSKEQKES